MNTEQKSAAKEGKTGGRKHLNRFVHFLMYGGWILVLFVIVGIVIAVSTCGSR